MERRWEAEGYLPLRPERARATRSTRSTRRRRRSAARCTSATCSRTRTPTSSRAFSACAARRCSIRWDGTTTACRPSAACRTTTASAAIRRCRTTRHFTPPEKPGKQPISVSRPNFIELCNRLTAEDEKAFEQLWRHLGLSVDWSMTYATIGRRAQRVSQAGVSAAAEARHRVPARGADAVGRRLPHRGGAGRARGPRAAGRVSPDPLRAETRSAAATSRSRRRGRS